MIYCFYFLEEYNIEFPVKIILFQSNFLVNHVLGKGVLLHMNNNSKNKNFYKSKYGSLIFKSK